MSAASTLSSTTRIRRGGGGGPGDTSVTGGAATATGAHARRSVKTLPFPSPSLAAARLPPWSSAMLLREREADPEPSVDRVVGPMPLPEHLEDVLEMRRADPDAGVDDRHHDVPAVPHGLEADSPARFRELRGVREKVGKGLGETHRVGVQDHPSLGQDLPERLPPADEERPGRLEGALDDRLEGDPLAAQIQLPVRDAGEVEKVVDQPHHVRGPAARPRRPRAGVSPFPRACLPIAKGSPSRSRAARAGCGARGPAWRRTRPSGGRPRAARARPRAVRPPRPPAPRSSSRARPSARRPGLPARRGRGGASAARRDASMA